MSGLFRPHYSFLQTNAWMRQAQNALRYNTSQVGAVVPVIYGTVRQQMNLIAFGGFRGPGGGKKGKGVGPLPIGGTSTTSKGGGDSKKGGKKAPPDFSIDLDMGICEGPADIATQGRVWASAQVANWGDIGLNFYRGENGQAADPTYAALDVPSINYSGTCHITGTPMDLGQSPVIPNLSFEIKGFLFGTLDGLDDADPGAVITHFLTDPQHGALFPAEFVNSMADVTLYCQQANMGISVSMDGQQTAVEWLNGMLKLINCTLLWSGGLLSVIPMADSAVGTWQPNLVGQYIFNADDILRDPVFGGDVLLDSADPIAMTRTTPVEVPNWVSMEYLDRVNNYNSTILSAFDQSAIDNFGLRTGENIQGRPFATPYAANFSAQTILQRLQYVRNTLKFKVGWKYSLLEPMDIVQLSNLTLMRPNSDFQGPPINTADNYLNGINLRILSIEEDDNGDLELECEEVPNGLGVHPIRAVPPWNNSQPIHFWYGGNCANPWDFNRVPGTSKPGGNLFDEFLVPQVIDPKYGCMSVWIKPSRNGMQFTDQLWPIPLSYVDLTPEGSRPFPTTAFSEENEIQQHYPNYFYSGIMSFHSAGAWHWPGKLRYGSTLVDFHLPPPGLGRYEGAHLNKPTLAVGLFADGRIACWMTDYSHAEGEPGGPPPGYIDPYWPLQSAIRIMSAGRPITWGAWQNLYITWNAEEAYMANQGFDVFLNGNRVTMVPFPKPPPTGGGVIVTNADGGTSTIYIPEWKAIQAVGWHGAYWGGWQMTPELFYYNNGFAGCVTDFWFSHNNTLGLDGWKHFYDPSTRRAIFDLGEFGEKPFGGVRRPDLFYRNYNGSDGATLPPFVNYPPPGIGPSDVKVYLGAGIDQSKKDVPGLYPTWPMGSGFLGYGLPITACHDNPWEGI